MASSIVAISCPHCKKSLKVPTNYLGRSVRCKGCSQTFKADTRPIAVKPGVTPAVPARSKTTENPQEQADYIHRMARSQRSSSLIFAVIVLLAISAISAGLFVFKDKIFGLIDQAQASKPVATEKQEPLLLGKEEKIDERSGDLTQIQAPDKEKRNRRNLARIPAPYPGRALLVGIRNYLYLNPLNPGYRSERSFLRDPLGLHTLRRTLTTELSFPRDQVLVLSDMDDQSPTVPTRSTIESNIEELLSTSRAGDRIVLVLAMHAAVLGGKAYLIPVDGELPPENAKADAERDAKLAAKMISLSWLYEKLAACKARQKLLILDIAQSDPEAGVYRNTPGALDDILFQQIKTVPAGTQVWLPCQPKQHSYGFSSAGQNGSAFLDTLCQYATLSIEKNWKLIEKDPGLKAGIIPLILLAKQIHQETSHYLKERGYEQTPILLGQMATAGEAVEADPPPALVLKRGKVSDDVITGSELALVLKELAIDNDPTQAISPASFPPLLKSAFSKYLTDYASQSDLESKLSQWPLRAMTLKSIKVIDRSSKSFKMRFAEESDETSFKRKIEKEQETPAYVTAELADLLEEMKKLDEKREEETSLRWRAHFDFTQARILAQLAHIQEYSFVLGNKLRKDTPKLKDPKNHNGWTIVPQRRLEQKETRTYESDRQKLLAKIIKENPGTPWEILARREQATILGLTLQETFLEEGKPLDKNKARQ